MNPSSQIIECQVMQDFRSPKRNGNSVIYKVFTQGNRVKGSLLKRGDNHASTVIMFQTVDGFLIPKTHLNPLGSTNKKMSNATGEDIQYAEIVEDKPKTFKLPNAVKSDMNTFFKTKSKTAVNGALVGLIIGFAFAMAKGKSKLMFSAIGTVGGFVLGNMYNNYVNEDKK